LVYVLFDLNSGFTIKIIINLKKVDYEKVLRYKKAEGKKVSFDDYDVGSDAVCY
jgi:hypothetical protein